MAIVSNSEQQVVKSYTIEFYAVSNSYPLSSNPDSYLQIAIYDSNNNLYHIINNLPPETVYAYTFNSNDVGEYNVVYTIYESPETSNENYDIETVPFTVFEYQPTFTLPTVTCAELGKPFNFHPLEWNQNENDLCPVSPLDAEIEYKRYEFNINTSVYDLKNTVTYSISETGEITTPEDYAYIGGSWTPTNLAMVKMVVTVTNCSTSVEKATVFPVCGSWKIRRLACGNYRIYNYKNSNISYSLYKGVEPTTLLKTEQIPAFSYIELNLSEDGIYRVTADNITQYIFNYCSLETCMLDLQKRILLDENLCDECKLDKVLYQKALRLLPTYEIWKKLLDKDWVYDMQYKSTDVANEIPRLYEAEELYAELIKLCEDCGDSNKKCNC